MKLFHHLILTTFVAIASLSAQQPTAAGPNSSQAPAKSFIDYFLPTPIMGPLSKEVWGAKEVGPRDQKNGLEDPAMKQWHYWDGQIIKGPDGRYHLFGSRWDQAMGHAGWRRSKAVHAVSQNLCGPYEDKGLCWPENKEGSGHNVTALKLPDGRYAVVCSATRPGDVFVCKDLDGPYEYLGKLKTEEVNGIKMNPDNVTILLRPDGDFMLTARSGQIFISKAADGILGPYRLAGPRAFPAGIPSLEDPCLFYSGGLYHIIVNSWSTHKAYHLTSKDGITNWVNRGIAYDPTRDFVRYTDGTVNHWHKMERPGVYMENGEIKALTLASIDIVKKEAIGNNGHGSKIVVVPFDGAAFNKEMERLTHEP